MNLLKPIGIKQPSQTLVLAPPTLEINPNVAIAFTTQQKIRFVDVMLGKRSGLIQLEYFGLSLRNIIW